MGQIESYVHEYTALAPKVCGDQVLSTGVFGHEECSMDTSNPRNLLQNYSCLVICEIEEFRFTNDDSAATPINVTFGMVAVVIAGILAVL